MNVVAKGAALLENKNGIFASDTEIILDEMSSSFECKDFAKEDVIG